MIILATTTTNPHSEFCSDGARLNVALTRARRHLVVVGAASVLKQVRQQTNRYCSQQVASGLLVLSMVLQPECAHVQPHAVHHTKCTRARVGMPVVLPA